MACYTEHGLREQFGVLINLWRLAEDNLNITCNFMYCNHQVHTEFLITLHLQYTADQLSEKCVTNFSSRYVNHEKLALCKETRISAVSLVQYA
jgi:hypothetical protein